MNTPSWEKIARKRISHNFIGIWTTFQGHISISILDRNAFVNETNGPNPSLKGVDGTLVEMLEGPRKDEIPPNTAQQDFWCRYCTNSCLKSVNRRAIGIPDFRKQYWAINCQIVGDGRGRIVDVDTRWPGMQLIQLKMWFWEVLFPTRGLPSMTSMKILDFLTPSPPCPHLSLFEQPPLPCGRPVWLEPYIAKETCQKRLNLDMLGDTGHA